MYQHIVPAGVAPTSVVRYLSRAFPALPGWLVRETLRKKDIRINGTRSGVDAVVEGGDEMIFYVEERYFTPPLKIIYEDVGLIIVEKPAGIPVDSDRGNIGGDTMLNRIQAVYPDAQLCHRLDTGTGGVLMAAKNDDALMEALDAFRNHDLVKHYQCMVVGVPKHRQAQLKAYLVKDAENSRVHISDGPCPGGVPIETHYRLLDSKNGISMLDVTLITGRTHQIRAHLSHVGLPLLGDDKYGNREANRRSGRTHPVLWCAKIDWQTHSFCSKPPFSLDRIAIGQR